MRSRQNAVEVEGQQHERQAEDRLPILGEALGGLEEVVGAEHRGVGLCGVLSAGVLAPRALRGKEKARAGAMPGVRFVDSATQGHSSLRRPGAPG